MCRRRWTPGWTWTGLGGRLSFFFVSQNNLLEEVAKFRAARKVWAKVMRDRFKAQNPRSWMVRFHTQTAGASLTAQQPENNIVRVTIQALAAVLGGTQSLHTNSMDEALALPTEKTAQIALRTQQIIAHESGVADVIDAIGGSYYVERLTDRIEEEAFKYIERIDDIGGALSAIEMGFQQREIQENSYRIQMQVDRGERTVVGVNEFTSEEETEPEILRLREEVVRRQMERLQRVRSERDDGRVEQMLKRLDEAARSDANLMPVFIECVENYVTLGEISDVTREFFGEQREVVVI